MRPLGIHTALIVFAGLALCQSSQAETVTYLGVPLPVDSISRVAPDQAKLTLGTVSLLVDESELPRKVAEVYAGSPRLSAGLSWDVFSQLVTRSLQEKEEALSAKALDTMLRLETISTVEVAPLLDEVAAIPGGRSVLERVVSTFHGNAPKPEHICELINTLDDKALRRLKDAAVELVYQQQFQCVRYLEREAIRLLDSGDVEGGFRALTTVTVVFSDESRQFQRIFAARDQLARALESADSGDAAMVVRVVPTLKSDEWLAPRAAKAERALLGRAAAIAVSKGRFQDALKMIAAMDFQRRSTKDHELVMQLLSSHPGEVRAALDLPDVASALRSYSLKDDQIKHSYLSLLDKSILDAIEAGDRDVVSQLFDQLLAVRPDPNAGNDALRVSLVEKLLLIGDMQGAEQRFSEVRTDAPLALRLRLLTSRAGSTGLLLGALCVVVSLVAAFFVWTKKTSPAKRKAPEPSRRIDEPDESNLSTRKFVVYSPGIKVVGADSEYLHCLRKFGLKEGATLQQIKLAYRNAVKSCHPDLNPNAGSDDSARFIELTKTYDKLLALHAKYTGEQ